MNMTDDKTVLARPRRVPDKDSGPIGEHEAAFKVKGFSARMGKGFMAVALVVATGLGAGVGVVGAAALTKDDVKGAVKEAVKEAAPNPALASKVAEDVSKMGDTVVKMGDAMSSMAADVKVLISEKSTMQRQLDQNAADIRELQKIIPTVREMEDMRQQLRDTKKEVDDLKADVRTLKDRK